MSDFAEFLSRQSMQELSAAINAQIEETIRIHQDGTACEVAKRIYHEMLLFQSRLPDESDIALSAATFGGTTTILVESIGYIGDSLVVFYGKDSSNKPLELIQHTHQLNFLLYVAARPEPELPRRPIGFAVPADEATDE